VAVIARRGDWDWKNQCLAASTSTRYKTTMPNKRRKNFVGNTENPKRWANPE
jgi:hypothetical protein